MEHVPCLIRKARSPGRPLAHAEAQEAPRPSPAATTEPHHITALHRQPRGLKEQILQDHTAQLRFRFLSKNKWG